MSPRAWQLLVLALIVAVYAPVARLGFASDELGYLVDLGMGSYHGFVQSGLWPQTGANDTLSGLRGLFFTHLHSDHTTDWPAVYATGSMNTATRTGACSRRTGPPRRWSTHRTRLRGSAA